MKSSSLHLLASVLAASLLASAADAQQPARNVIVFLADAGGVSAGQQPSERFD